MHQPQQRILSWMRIGAIILLSLGLSTNLLANSDRDPTNHSSPAEGRQIVLLLDNSGSMHEHDPDHKIHRALRHFIQRLNPSDQAAVILFDDKVSQIAGLTQTNASGKTEILQALAALNYRGKYTNTAAALEKAIYTLRIQDPDPNIDNPHKIILLITDGVVDTGNAARNRENVQWMRHGLANEAARLNIAIYGIAVTEAADFQTLQSLAQKTAANYFRADSSNDVKLVLSRILRATSPIVSVNNQAKPNKPDVATTIEPSPQTPVDQTTATESGLPASRIDSTAPPSSVPVVRQHPEDSTRYIASTESTTATLKPPTHSPRIAQPNSLMSLNSNSLLLLIILVVVLIVAILFFWLAKNRQDASKPDTSGPSTPKPAAPASVAAAQRPPVTPTEQMVVLHDLSGISGQDKINLSGEVIIGRKAINPATSLVIPSTTISRQHAQFVSENNAWWIVDLGSGNGTFVNGKRIASRQQLNEGDIIAFDEYKFRFGDAAFTGNETVIRDENATIAQLPSEDVLASHASTAQRNVSEIIDPTGTDSTNFDLDSVIEDNDQTIADFVPAGRVNSETDADKTVADWSLQNNQPANSEEEAFTILPDAVPTPDIDSNIDLDTDLESEIDLDFQSGKEAEQIAQAATTQFHAGDIDASVFKDEDSTIAIYSGVPKTRSTPSADANNDSDATIAIPSPATGGKPRK